MNFSRLLFQVKCIKMSLVYQCQAIVPRWYLPIVSTMVSQSAEFPEDYIEEDTRAVLRILDCKICFGRILRLTLETYA